MSGSFGEMGSLLKQAQEMQKEFDRVREELRGREIIGLGGGGIVKVVLNGQSELQRVELADSLVAEGDPRHLEEEIANALRDALAQASKLREEEGRRVTGGVNLPGFF